MTDRRRLIGHAASKVAAGASAAEAGEVPIVASLQWREPIQEVMSGHTWACASRPIRIARCCKQTPIWPGHSMMRASLVGIASINGLTESRGATWSALQAWAQTRFVDRPKCRQFSERLGKKVLAIEPLDELMDQFAWKGNLVEGPALDPCMNFHCVTVGDAQCCVRQP
jgi:hypothetical protein